MAEEVIRLALSRPMGEEILWNVNKLMDQNLSRFQDAAILQGQPKPFFHENDRATAGWTAMSWALRLS